MRFLLGFLFGAPFAGPSRAPFKVPFRALLRAPLRVRLRVRRRESGGSLALEKGLDASGLVSSEILCPAAEAGVFSRSYGIEPRTSEPTTAS